METPILMTDEQKRSYLKTKTTEFIAGLKLLEESTGMTIQADLAFTPTGIFPRVQIVPKQPNEQKGPTQN